MARALAALAGIAFAWAPTAEGGALRGQQALSGPVGTIAQLHVALTQSLSSPEVEKRVAELMEELHPVFLALPRSAEGYLDASAVRYLLHRIFLERDGWFVQGWDASGEDADNSLPKTVLQDDPLASAFSERLAARGLSLREVAMLVMAVETLASRETEQRLEFAYQFWTYKDKGPSKVHADEHQLSGIHKVYLLTYLMGYDSKNVVWNELSDTLERTLDDIYVAVPNWDKFWRWFGEVRDEVAALLPERERFSFKGQVRILDEVEHRYGRWQDQDCIALKRGLLELATPGTGRVSLSKFYTATLVDGWTARESKEYLQEIGALDETDPSDPRVVIPNYFDTPSNCMNTSAYYSVCCISECEPLLGSLERKLGSPNASPKQIVEIIESLPSATVEAPRTLPGQLVARIEMIAEMHGGHAPLHSRLFRQWMHHAYPAECVFPALSMTRKSRTLEEFEAESGLQSIISEEARQRYVEEEAKRAADTDPVAGNAALAQELPWSDEEELLVTCRGDGAGEPSADKLAKPSYGSWRIAVLLFIVASMTSMLVKEARSSRFKSCGLPVYGKEKCMV